MTELSGELEGVGLAALVRFLGGLNKTGCLHVAHGDWQGEVYFAGGQVIGARLGSRQGLTALDALVQVMVGGTFVFDVSPRVRREADITLTREALLAHLEGLLRRIESGAVQLPALDAVPEVVVQADPETGAEPLPLDRLTLLTLLAVDGVRTAREIIAMRGSIDALWQLGNLAEVGLIRVPPRMAAAETAATAAAATLFETPEVPPGEATSRRPVVPEVHEGASHCPKLGFEDDPKNSFDRPTRLHRCFAAATPLPLSIDQQRELCLSDHFSTCPRLGSSAPSTPARPIGREPLPLRPSTEHQELLDSRVVRLPFGGRNRPTQRGPLGDRQAVGAAELTQFRQPNAAPRAEDAPRPTQLRPRADHEPDESGGTHGQLGVDEAQTTPEQPRHGLTAARQRLLLVSSGRRLGGVPVRLIAAIALVSSVLGVIAYLLLPYLNDTFPSDDSLANLPNASAVAAGEPVSRVLTPQLTPVARATPIVGAAAGASVSAAASPVTAAPPAAQSPTSAAPAISTLLDETFANNALNWPSNSQGNAWVTTGGYRLTARQSKQFVAIGAPLVGVPANVVVSATFRKVAGPPGGGYGIILRDQGDVALDGNNQGGHFYVLEAGDKGEIGIWRRDVDHWVDVLSWQPSDAVHQDTASNQLTASAIGDRLSLSVNGTEVATRTDATLPTGGVGLFTGGDDNQVVVEHVSVRTP